MESHGAGLRHVLVLAFCVAGIWSGCIYQGVLQETVTSKEENDAEEEEDEADSELHLLLINSCPLLSIAAFFVGNIPYDATEEQLIQICEEVGPVVFFRDLKNAKKDLGKNCVALYEASSGDGSLNDDGCKYSARTNEFVNNEDMLMYNIKALVILIQPEEAERDWFAFVLYSVKRLSETNADDSSQGTGGDGFTLCQVLRVAKLNIVDFFKELPQFIVKAGQILSNQYGTDWEKILEVNQLGVVISVQVVPQQEKCSNALLVAWTCLQMPIHNRA